MNANGVQGRTQLLRNNVFVRTISEWDNNVDTKVATAETELRYLATAAGIVVNDDRLNNGFL